MQKILIFLVLVVAAPASAAEAALLVYKVWEQGGEPYISRMLVTERHVRLDEGAAGDFTLFDRRTGRVYNVSSEDHSILVLAPPEAVPKPPSGLVLTHTEQPDAKAPRVAGRAPRRVELLANGARCTTLTVVSGLMESALQGLRELRLALARYEAAAAGPMPESLQTACELAATVAPTRTLDHGLPLSEEDTGRLQLLLDYQEHFPVDDALFRLPEGYRWITW